ncbi:hypothetical protein OIE73_37070 [Streptomyces hirsutus]|uniref:Integral membrane protein n=1 Tax=Streptomyces hirsutus TaxID=35620 RepID=A0ABZ1GZN1_9ACTN|nr:DUF6629 family protein [Streptomyces hirsutus]WSD10757.1 hypothetical protein OIE73_37070 [Streptomyces hirsutus]
MCWSAEADLVAGAGISAVGTACAARALRTGRTGDLPLAALPLLLGVHQMIEAAVWASDGGTGPAVLLWAVVALPLLALWVPVGVLCAAPKDARRDALRRLMLPLVAGAVTAAVLGRVLTTRPVRAEIRGRTIGYVVDLSYAPLLVAGYLVATAGPLLLSGDRGLRALGVLAGAGALVCWTLWRLEFVSTWCAFAAVCSLVLFGWVRGRGRRAGSTAPAG